MSNLNLGNKPNIAYSTIYTGNVSKLFDGVVGVSGSGWGTGTEGLVLESALNKGFAGIDLGQEHIVNSIVLKGYSGTNVWHTMTIKQFKLQGNNTSLSNGESWVDIFTGETSSSNGVDVFNFENNTPYRYYRLFTVSNWGYGGYVSLSEWEMYEKPKNIKHLLKSNNLIYSLDTSNNLVDITSQIADINNITQLEYETLGFDDMSLVNMTQLGSLQSPKSVIYYTDDTAITNPKLKHEYSFNIGTRLLKRG